MPFIDSVDCFIKPAFLDDVEKGYERLKESISELDSNDIRHSQYEFVSSNNNARKLLDSIFGSSPFLTDLVIKNFSIFSDFCEYGAEKPMRESMFELAGSEELSLEQIMRLLRIAKSRIALLIALCDISEIWDVTRVTAELSYFAEVAISKAAENCLYRAYKSGQIEIEDIKNPAVSSGLIILGMGKLGGAELNYSSDVDLIIFYDRERSKLSENINPQRFFVKLVQEIVTILQERTAEGYVFRTDLRLRPDPASTPVAISVNGAITYYETVGQNWERVALIKARPIGGDIIAADNFIKYITPFIWRKSLDFNAVRDIQSIKRQMDRRLDSDSDKLADYNVKLGKGGIREIEFFAQTQQLIWGGKQPNLRARATCDALMELVNNHHISEADANFLIKSYYYHRKVEHRLQMLRDEQTHTIPDNEDEIKRLAFFMGYESVESFEKELFSISFGVNEIYGNLYKDTPSLGFSGNTLVFTGVENDPSTIATIAAMGFLNAEMISNSIRAWHHGSRRATRTKRARELITELTPAILNAFAKTPSPDYAFRKFDEFLSRLPASAQLFSLFQATPNLISLIAEIMGTSLYLSEMLSRKPTLLDALLYPNFFKGLPSADDLHYEVNEALKNVDDFDEKYEVIRRFVHERQFQAGVQLLKNITTVDVVGAFLSDLAQISLTQITDIAKQQFEKEYGKFAKNEFAILAFGKFGSKSLGLNSDLDIVFLYDAADEDERSNGSKSFLPNVYYIRFSQRLISAITTISDEGRLYEVDTRLRPHGVNGPIAINIEGFDEYYRHSAWRIEFLSLIRARVVYGSFAMVAKVNEIMKSNILSFAAKSYDDFARKVVDIRKKIAEQYNPNNIFDIKHARGGLMDLEILIQYLQVQNAHIHTDVITQNSLEALNSLKKHVIIDIHEYVILSEALTLYLNYQQYAWLLCNNKVNDENTPERLREMLAGYLRLSGYKEMEEKLRQTSDSVYKLYKEKLEEY